MSQLERRSTVMERVLGGSPLGVFVRLVVTSFVVGVILTALDVNPQDIVLWIEERFRYFSTLGFDTLENFARILILGAVVVLPIWLIMRVIKLMSR
ncbi:DUF6460 domain-containing protein [Acuticoccus sp. M5D2P5]|uniref:DUF6460 domain-containing protein n=1 Tax=Acuticoccus kalidii TaxID=2910977 RepID=UPI001F1869F6|nr:DUF6460 domain-containing protein [Acuticoccus kalidii]MCF3933814.1 DUF6460 domain-containing protein [Acuticoccus kalidii]